MFHSFYDSLNKYIKYIANNSLLFFHNWWILKIIKCDNEDFKNVYFYQNKNFANPNFSNFILHLNLLVKVCDIR